jgi:hypothetical protein
MSPSVYLGGDGPERDAWEAGQGKSVREAQIRADVASGIDINRVLGEQNQAILDAADAIAADAVIQNYDPAGKTANQVLADVLAGLKALDRQVKQVAQGVAIMARHDQVALEQRNYLARLALADYSGTD